MCKLFMYLYQTYFKNKTAFYKCEHNYSQQPIEKFTTVHDFTSFYVPLVLPFLSHFDLSIYII